MPSIFALCFIAVAVLFGFLHALLFATQSKREPRAVDTAIPFLGPACGIAREKVDYLMNLKSRYQLPIYTMRTPFQRLYVVHAPHFIQSVQNKANMSTFVPNLLDFGMLFSGLNKDSQQIVRAAHKANGNNFTKSVHKHLTTGSGLRVATRAAIDKLSASVPNSFTRPSGYGLFDLLRHDLTLALTGAVYGSENPFDDPAIETAWQEFVPGISHLLYSPMPQLTARKALSARARIIDAFKTYFDTDGHLQALPMVAEMFEANKAIGLSPMEAAKFEIATSLAMLSSGAITAFWLAFHILSNPDTLQECRKELLILVTKETETTTGSIKVIDLSMIKTQCSTLMAMMQETLRYHSTVINIKQVQYDTTLASEYDLKKGAILMIPGTSVHHDTEIWGNNATNFNHHRFLAAEGRKKLSNTSAYRPFGAGTTMCPGRHFSTNVILSLVAMVLLQFDVTPMQEEWHMPTKKNADLWNAMPKPDSDIPVNIVPRKAMEHLEWKFVWGQVDES